MGGANSNRGANALKSFLRYADTGMLVEEGEVTGKEPESDFEVAVAKALGQHGYSVEPQVGVSGYRIDLGVYHPDREKEFIVGIECDGATYHSARHARDRDRLREEVLVLRGWTIHRIWSADWFKNRFGEVDRLVTTLNKIRETDRHRARKVALPELTKPTERKPEERDTGQVLKAKLLKYRNENIPPREKAPTDGLLRNEMLMALIETRPTIKEEFRARVPLQLREKINLDELQYLDDVLGIIEEAQAQ